MAADLHPDAGFQKELDAGIHAARRAGALALRYFLEPGSPVDKEDRSPVTIADIECERLIAGMLSEEFPEDGIFGEEGAFRTSRSGRRWIIDPIDGTRDFVRRTSFWAVQLALESQGRIVLGVIYLPRLDEIVHAVAGRGCFWNGEVTRAADTSRLDKSIVLLSGFQSAWDTWPTDKIRYLTQSCWTVRAYSACYDVVMMARGKADIWLSGNGMPWDYAPARVIAQESGAHFVTKDGTGRIDARHCVIVAPALKKIVCEILEMPGG